MVIMRAWCMLGGALEELLRKRKIKLGEFTIVSQPIRLILVDWFVFHFCLGRFPFFFGCLHFFYFFVFRSSSIFNFFEVVILVFQKKYRLSSIFIFFWGHLPFFLGCLPFFLGHLPFFSFFLRSSSIFFISSF